MSLAMCQLQAEAFKLVTFAGPQPPRGGCKSAQVSAVLRAQQGTVLSKQQLLMALHEVPNGDVSFRGCPGKITRGHAHSG